jgi:hypothetical protein
MRLKRIFSSTDHEVLQSELANDRPLKCALWVNRVLSNTLIWEE